MPRNGAGVYSYPIGTEGVPNTTVESAKYNTYIADIQQDLNIPRPIVAGGTGGGTAHDAMINLGAEFAGQLVTNYDSFAFAPGSFFSAPGATGAPDAIHSFSGICYQANPSSVASVQMFLEARAHGAANLYYYREKNTAWGAWTPVTGEAVAIANAKVSKTGDVMSGQLTLNYDTPLIHLNKTINPSAAFIVGSLNASQRWQLHLGTNAPESGGNAGSNFGVYRFDDSGNFIGPSIEVIRSNNQFTVSGPAALNGTLNVAGAATLSGPVSMSSVLNVAGAVIAGSGRFLAQNVTVPSFAMLNGTSGVAIFNGGGPGGSIGFGAADGNGVPTSSVAVMTAGGAWTFQSITVNGTATFSGVMTFAVPLHFAMTGSGAGAFYDNTASANRFFCGTDTSSDIFRIYSALTTTNVLQLAAGAPTGIALFADGRVNVGNGVMGKQGIGGAYSVYANNFWWTGSTHQVWVDASNVGNMTIASDYRIKKDVAELHGTWDTVKALRPVKYTQAEFSPPSHLAYIAERQAAAKTDEELPHDGPLFVADDIERWGFVAHELQETLVPSAASGEKDSDDTVQSPNPWTVIAATVKALQEAQTRIEALEEQLLSLVEGRSLP